MLSFILCWVLVYANNHNPNAAEDFALFTSSIYDLSLAASRHGCALLFVLVPGVKGRVTHDQHKVDNPLSHGEREGLS